MNITDVDDRIIRDLQAAGGTLDELTAPHIARFEADMKDLRVGPPTHLTRATRPHPGDGGDHRQAARERARVPDGRWLDLLPHLVVAGLRHAGQARSGGGARRRARRGRRLRQGRRARLRAVEGPKAGRADVADRDRRGPPGLAHRVLGDEHEIPRRVVRHPHRRRRPDLSAPRERDRPVRGGDGQALRERVAAQRPPRAERREDGAPRRQHQPPGRGLRGRLHAGRCSATR